VREQGIGRLQDAPDARFLVSVELNRPAYAGQRQMVAVERADARVVESVVVKTAEPLTPRVIRPDPFLEPLFDSLLFLAGSLSGLRVDDGLFVLVQVIDRGCLEVERVFDEFEGGVAVRTPIGCVGGCPSGLPSAGGQPAPG